MPGVEWKSSALEAARGADALIVATGWEEFVLCDWAEVKGVMNGAVVLDGRNILDQEAVKKAGLQYAGVGRP